MRIRKHAKKISATFPLSSPSGAASSHSTLLQCQLNQSPWDVISFPPDSSSSSPLLLPPFQYLQVHGDDSFTGNASFGDSAGAVESVASMKMSLGDEEDDDRAQALEDSAVKEENLEDYELGFANGKSSKEGESMSKQYQLKNSPPATKRSNKTSSSSAAAATNPRRGRPRKSASASASNPYEFYYYSGFGPRWGKKRGAAAAAAAREEEANNNSSGFAPDHQAAPTAMCYSPTQIEEEELDFIYEEDDDDDDEDDNEEEYEGKKRGRKPIKARSLKSLM